jgi:polyhydroxyalkanoate synthesis regulator phasin
MSKTWKTLSIAALVVVVALAAFATVASAQEPETQSNWPFGWARHGILGDLGDAIASKLGITRADLDKAVDEARQEAIEQAVAEGTITEEQAQWMLDPTGAMKEQIQQMVEDGRITQEQADWMLQGLEQGYMPMMRGFGKGFGGHGPGGHGGMRGGHFFGGGFPCTPPDTTTPSSLPST